MSTYIQARNRRGGVKFRMWSTFVDGYYTEPLSEEAMRNFMAESMVMDALNDFEISVDQRISRAKEDGISMHGEKENLDGPWSRQRKSSPISPDCKKEWKEKLARQKKLLERILANWPEE